MNKLATAACMIGFLTAGPTAAYAKDDCDLTITGSPASWTISNYSPFDGTSSSQDFNLVLYNAGDKDCRGDIVAEITTAFGLTNPTGAKLSYVLLNSFNNEDIAPKTGRSDGPKNEKQIVVLSKQTIPVRITFGAVTTALAGDGVYSQTVNFRFEARGGGNPDKKLLAAKAIPLSLGVSPTSVMGLRGAFQRVAGVPSVDLGELTQGTRNLPLNLYVLSTRGYRVSVSSQNLGRLVNVTDNSWSVPYGLSFGSNSVNLATGGSFATAATPGMRDDTYPVNVLVGEVTGRRAGRYSDLVTLTVAPL